MHCLAQEVVTRSKPSLIAIHTQTAGVTRFRQLCESRSRRNAVTITALNLGFQIFRPPTFTDTICALDVYLCK